MSSSNTISRRAFVSTGASLLAAGASLLIQPRAYGVTPDSVHASRQTTSSKEGAHHSNADMARCIKLCQECHAMCTQTIAHCLKLGGRHAANDHIQLLIDCTQMCMITADYLSRKSVIHERVCSVCADICRFCAESCEKVAGDDNFLKQCADLCRRCLESCESMGSKAA